MKRLSDATNSDFAFLLDSTKKLSGFNNLEEVAQSFIDVVYEYFQKSLVLLRLFSSFPYSALSIKDKRLVKKR